MLKNRNLASSPKLGSASAVSYDCFLFARAHKSKIQWGFKLGGGRGSGQGGGERVERSYQTKSLLAVWMVQSNEFHIFALD